MGDRTTVTLSVLTEQKEAAAKLFTSPANEENEDGPITLFIFDNVNYGNLDFLSKLEDAGIPFDSSWEEGSEYSSGTAYCRYDSDGSLFKKEIFDASINPDLYILMQYIDQPKELREYILSHKQSVTVVDLTDESQLTNAKLWLARKLIGLDSVD